MLAFLEAALVEAEAAMREAERAFVVLPTAANRAAYRDALLFWFQVKQLYWRQWAAERAFAGTGSVA